MTDPLPSSIVRPPQRRKNILDLVTNSSLPTRLGKEPLLDVLFEIRFKSKLPVSSILPGIIFSKFPQSKMEQLPQSHLPQIVRQQTPELRYAPLVRVLGDEYAYLVGDNSFSISSLIPYRGWQHFKNKILESVDLLASTSLIDVVERFSLKYIDLIEISTRPRSEILNASLQIGGKHFSDSNYQVQTELHRRDMIALIQIISSAKVQAPGTPDREGIIVDIDTIFQADEKNLDTLLPDFASKIDTIHSFNKEVFFSVLSPKALELLEPIYE